MDVSSAKAKAGDHPFHSPASFNVIYIAGITLHTLVVARSGKLCCRQEQLFVNRVCMNTLRQSPIAMVCISNLNASLNQSIEWHKITRYGEETENEINGAK